MSKAISNALRAREAKALFNAGLEMVSTDRQLQNGTIALGGKLQNQQVMYRVTANGVVLNNRTVARLVDGETETQMYRNGLKAVGELLARRRAVTAI